MNLAELLELAGVLLILAGIAWLLGVLIPAPYGWPLGVVAFGAGLLLAAALAAKSAKSAPRGADVE